MLRYLRSRIGGSYEVKTDHYDDFVNFTKLITHGFPKNISSIAVDGNSGLISVGTSDGRLIIFNPNGFQLSTCICNKLPISFLSFVAGSNTLMVLCSDVRKSTQHFIKCQIMSDHLNLVYFDKEKHLKRITCCETLNAVDADGNSALLIGTISGNIYALWIQKMELVEYIVFLDTSLKDIHDLGSHQNEVNGIIVSPEDKSKLYLLFNGFIFAFYDVVSDEVLRVYHAKQFVTCMTLSSQTSKVLFSHNDGSYTVVELLSDNNIIEECTKPYDGQPCTKITKIISSKSINIGEDFVIFSGGVPFDELGDRYTISIFCGDKSLILDFDSLVKDFCLLKSNDISQLLLVHCEEELVAIDLRDPLWRMLPLPQLCSIHSSPVTFLLAVSGISENALFALNQLAIQQFKSSQIFSKNGWPDSEMSLFDLKRTRTGIREQQLILTGHENGVVNIWMATAPGFMLWLSLDTGRDFDGYIDRDVPHQSPYCDEVAESLKTLPDGKLPPIRKAGIFDPYSDDYRLAIQKLFFDSDNIEIVVGGRAGQLLVYKALAETSVMPPNDVLLLDMTTSAEQVTSANRLRSESAIQARSVPVNYHPGFCLLNNTIVQFKPAVPITSLCWIHHCGFLVAGNEFGYAICSLGKKEILLIRTLIASIDIVQLSNMDGPLSRFKSVKKSIRQSFRKKRRQNGSNNEKLNGNLRPMEREIVRRNINPNLYGGETPASLVKVTNFYTCNLSTGSERHLFVGTHGGVIFIHAIRPSSLMLTNDCGKAEIEREGIIHNTQCPLIKEIHLQHQAPVVSIECMRGSGGGGHLLVFTEEQIRSFTLPGLKPARFKLRFTALEGSRIKKAGIVQLRSRIRRTKAPENFVALVTNRGEVYLIPIASSLRKQYRVEYTECSDSTAILYTALSNDGQLFYLRPGGSELEQCSLCA